MKQLIADLQEIMKTADDSGVPLPHGINSKLSYLFRTAVANGLNASVNEDELSDIVLALDFVEDITTAIAKHLNTDTQTKNK